MAIKIIKMTPEQEQCVKFRSEGELLVRGIPGAGKTTVILERAVYLSMKGEHISNGPKVLLLTYNRALATYIKQMARASKDEAVEAKTFHQWGSQLLREAGINNYRTISDEKEGFVRYAKNIICKYGDPDLPKVQSPKISEDRAIIRFLSEEISWLKNNEITTLAQYLKAQRVGRGTQVQLSKSHRESVFDIYEKYQSILKSKRAIDFDDVAILIINHINRIPMDIRPNHVLIDEAQDLTATQLKAIKLLTIKSLTIAADKGQQIYRRSFSWKSVGIEIRGARSKSLSKSFRSTKQIIELARSLQQHDNQLISDDEYLPADPPDIDGPLPEVLISGKLTEELATVVRKARQIKMAFPDDSIAIIAYSGDRLEDFEQSFTQHGIGTIYIKSDEADFITPGIKLVTFHSSKGLEFDHVIVTGLQEGKLPYRTMDPGDDPEAFKATERRKLYVAMTRARLTLTLSAVNPISPFIHELDPNLYR